MSHASPMSSADEPVIFEWRGAFSNLEVNELHAEAFETRVFDGLMRLR